jgi:ABC-type branched-subunit amino acid transport system substrate-binding protein
MQPKRFISTVALILVAFLISITSFVLASPRSALVQAPQPLNIGVIGPDDGPTAFGVRLAVQRINAVGPVTGPDGTAYSLAVVTADAGNAADVGNAITTLKKSNVVAIFGPDDDKLAVDSLSALGGAGVPVFTGATTTALKGGNLVFRTRAADSWQMLSLAQVLTTDLKKSKIAIYQGNPNVTSPVGELVNALNKLGKPALPPVIQVQDGKIADSVKVLTDSQPDTVVAFGDMAQVADLYRNLRAVNYGNAFVTVYADRPAFIQSLPLQLRRGIFGVTTWPYSWPVPDSQNFTRDYVDLFGQIPGPLSAGAYDSAVALAISVKTGGITPDGIRVALLKLQKTNSLQGTFNPLLGNNDLSASTAVIQTNDFGAPTILARFDETGRLKIIDVTPTLVPTATQPPTATPNGVVGTMKSTVNVRTGPGTVYPVIGQLRKGDQEQLVGASSDFKWYVINFRQQQGWISASLVDVFGDVKTLPVVAPPPTPIPSPTPPASATPAPPPQADIIMVSATMNPPIPQPGQPFTLSVIIKNQGNIDAPGFAVATTFEPGGKYTAVNLPGLGAGQQTQVDLPNTVGGTIVHTLAIVLDLNNQVDEGPTGEANNKPTFTYRIDHTYAAQGNISINPGNSADFDGGGADVGWDGTNLAPLAPGKIGILGGVVLEQVHYDLLAPSTVNTAPLNKANLGPGTLIAIYTAQNKRGVLRVSGYAGNTIQLEYFIYN